MHIVGRLPLAIVAALALAAWPARAGDAVPVGIGEVTAAAASAEVDVAALRAMVAEAVASLDPAGLPHGRAAVLSVSLVRLESRPAAPAEVTCTVSATLRDRAHGSVFAILEGSARGQDDPSRVHALERATMRAAVSGVVARVPEALRRRPR